MFLPLNLININYNIKGNNTKWVLFKTNLPFYFTLFLDRGNICKYQYSLLISI